jgi:hypothetical protein
MIPIISSNNILSQTIFLSSIYSKISKNGAYRSGCLRRFGGPNKQMRSICRADKMWVEAGVGMSEANDLASRNPEPPTGGEA